MKHAQGTRKKYQKQGTRIKEQSMVGGRDHTVIRSLKAELKHWKKI